MFRVSMDGGGKMVQREGGGGLETGSGVLTTFPSLSQFNFHLQIEMC